MIKLTESNCTIIILRNEKFKNLKKMKEENFMSACVINAHVIYVMTFHKMLFLARLFAKSSLCSTFHEVETIKFRVSVLLP